MTVAWIALILHRKLRIVSEYSRPFSIFLKPYCGVVGVLFLMNRSCHARTISVSICNYALELSQSRAPAERPWIWVIPKEAVHVVDAVLYFAGQRDNEFVAVMSLVLAFGFFLGALISAQEIPSSRLRPEHRGDNCDCMEYWSCITRGGNPYSYCGLSESSVCCLLPPTESSAGFSSPLRGKPRCGLKGYDSGREGFAEPSEWPWHVAIVEEPGFFYVCGGTLIDEFWILTAAHCVHDYYQNPSFKLKVRLGEYDVTKTTENLRHEDRLVEKIILHPKFDNETLLHDIALLKLQFPAKQRPHIDVVCLPKISVEFPLYSKCVITGWGKTDEDSRYSDILKEIIIPLWNKTFCEESLKKEFGSGYRLPDSIVCAGSQEQDACDGDGGGPLVCQREGQWFQVGIISFGIGCGQKNAPGVYTLVPYYERWIKDIVLLSKIKV